MRRQSMRLGDFCDEREGQRELQKIFHGEIRVRIRGKRNDRKTVEQITPNGTPPPPNTNNK